MDCLQIAHFLPIINYIINCVFLSKMNLALIEPNKLKM